MAIIGRTGPDTISSDAQIVAAASTVGRYRWVICGLLFAATAINYVDRQMIGVLKPTISKDLGWSETTYADVIFWFQAAYALGYLSFGRIVDAVGARIGYSIAFVIWTLGHTLCGFVGSAFQFSVARFILGIGESGNFPAGLKSVTEWFPAKERALATGIFNAGANVGAAELQAHVKDKRGAPWAPKTIDFVEAIPVTGTAWFDDLRLEEVHAQPRPQPRRPTDTPLHRVNHRDIPHAGKVQYRGMPPEHPPWA